MTKLYRNVTTVLLTILLAATLTACQKQGPAEQAGEKVDEAVDKAGQQIEKAGEKIQDTAKGDK